MDYTDGIARANIMALLKMYVRKYPDMSTEEIWSLMKKEDSNFLGLDLTSSEIKSLNIKQGKFFKKRKKKK